MEKPTYESPRPNENPSYGWKKDAAPRKSKGSGGKIFFAVAGAFLVVFGALGLAGIGVASYAGRSYAETAEDVYVYEDTCGESVAKAAPVPEVCSVEISGVTAAEAEEYSEAYAYVPSLGVRGGGTSFSRSINLGDAGVETVSVVIGAADVSIFGHDSDSLDISMDINSGTEYSVETVDNELVIKGRGDADFPGITRGGPDVLDTISLAVPYSYEEAFKIAFAAGSVNMFQINGSDLSIEMAAGSFALADAAYESLGLELAAGDFDGTGLDIEALTVESIAGNAAIEGNIGDTNVDCIAGGVSVTYAEMPRRINVSAMAGTTDIHLPEGSRFELENPTVAGGYTNDFDTPPGSSENEISLTTLGGTVNILKY